MKRNAPNQDGVKPKRVAKGHKLAPKLPQGTILTDNSSMKWKLGDSIGSGGFGCLYLAKQLGSTVSNQDYVIKLEPLENGPLFTEINFYIRSAKSNMIADWKTEKGISELGVPNFEGSGQLENDLGKFRFLVMPKFTTDLQKILDNNGKIFPPHTVFQLGLKLMDILQYIHEKGFTHADIKPANLMTGVKDPENIYLIDYGLAHRYMVDGKQQVYKADVKWAHNGTPEYTSRDAHAGAKPAPRGDLEIVGYCMWHWLSGSLPWEKNFKDPKLVHSLKNQYMADIKGQIAPCIKDTIASKELCNYLEEITNLNYNDVPNYDTYRDIFKRAIKAFGHKPKDKLSFNNLKIKSPLSKKRGPNTSNNNNKNMVTSPLKPNHNIRTSPRKVETKAINSTIPISPKPKLPVAQKPKISNTSPKVLNGVLDNQPNSAKKMKNTKPASKVSKIKLTSIATQTSPGMAGLPRSYKKNK